MRKAKPCKHAELRDADIDAFEKKEESQAVVVDLGNALLIRRARTRDVEGKKALFENFRARAIVADKCR
jgi:hypothetical protein